jgi:hypothetical protein
VSVEVGVEVSVEVSVKVNVENRSRSGKLFTHPSALNASSKILRASAFTPLSHQPEAEDIELGNSPQSRRLVLDPSPLIYSTFENYSASTNQRKTSTKRLGRKDIRPEASLISY